MSKAFTKDDGPHAADVQRHRQALPTGSSNYVTPSGLAALREELTHLEAEPGKHGPTWRAELEDRIATAVVPPPPIDRSEIRFGARVRIRAHHRDMEVRIVGVDEANPAKDSIAFVAPLARALLGRRVGDAVTVRTPGGEDELEVLAVDYEDER
jgi:transcription elongation factor GreB